MDWNEKFNSIVKETEENLAKAKEKLNGKTLTPRGNPLSTSLVNPASAGIQTPKEERFFNYLSSPSHQSRPPVGDYPNPYPAMNSSRSSDFQVLHMQDQIDSQNRTIDSLQQLVRTLNNERSFYKEQITQLKNEVDGLSDKVSSQVAMATSERHLSGIKREVMVEVDRLRHLVHSQAEVNRRQTPGGTLGLNSEFWTVKENLTDNLEQIRLELNLMNKRIDRIESQVSKDTVSIQNREFRDISTMPPNSTSLRSSLAPLHTPTSHMAPGINNLDIQNMKSTISSLNSKLDNLEKRVEIPPLENSTPLFSSLRSSAYSRNKRQTSPRSQTTRRYSDLPNDIDDDVLSDLSDLSELSSLSDLDLDNDEILHSAVRNDTSRVSRRGKVKNSIYKAGRKHKGKVEFDLSDLDLSDVEDIDIRDADSLDLDM